MKFTASITLVCALLLAGCLTQSQLIEKRIKAKQSFFESLTPENQERLRLGKVTTTDSPEAVWIVYGPPDRKFTKITGTTTNEVWSYCSYDFDRFDRRPPIYHPVMSPNGRMIWHADYIWGGNTYYEAYEYMRFEFENNRIKMYQTEQR
ncbi:MAG: hypothetical protein PHO37_10490 [Kiritimatiellae bacterium]|nr:hypothetical protein [Kiritimatiellia bacterium]